jgi:putative aldouronate transport system permease protein
MAARRRLTAFPVANVILMAAFAFICVYPFVFVLALSLNDGVDAQRGGIYFVPRTFSLENYRTIFKNADLVNAYGITIFRVVTGTLLSLGLTSLTGFALSRRALPFRRFFSWMVFVPMYFSGGIIPYYMVLNALHLTNRVAVYVVPMLFSSFNIILMRTFMKSLPESLFESARLDGAGELTVFTRIAFPLSGPVLATIALFTAVGHWNDWFTGLVFVFEKRLWPASTLLLNILRSSEIATYVNPKMFMSSGLVKRRVVTPESLKMAMLIVTTVPVLLVYPFLQKYFVKGVMIGSLKG